MVKYSDEQLNTDIGRRFGKLVIEGHFRKGGFIIYDCSCDCGARTTVRRNHLFSGNTASCGCLAASLASSRLKHNRRRIGGRKLPEGEAAFNLVYSNYRGGAKIRNLVFTLKREDFSKLIFDDCYYCGCPPDKTINNKALNGSIFYNGIDRLDSSEGYTRSNCVSCCKKCNYAKRDMSYDDFIELVCQIYHRHVWPDH